MDDMLMTLLGWRLSQWAQAKSLHYRLTRENVPADLNGAGKVHHWWMLRRADQPGEIRLVGVEPEMDYAWATNLFAAGFKVCKESSFQPPRAGDGRAE